jgi:hypothetical protein
MALLANEPRHPLVTPAANWLALNRRSAHWQSTRDTGFAVLALAELIKRHGDDQADADVEVWANDRKVQRLEISRDTVLKGPAEVMLAPEQLRAGRNRIVLKRVAGQATVRATALGSAWIAADTVRPAGHLAGIARELVREKSEATVGGTLRITPMPLTGNEHAVGGEEVEARVRLTLPNELEYVMVEVPKPAGCEPVNPLSGWDARLLAVEEDDRVAATHQGADRKEASDAEPGRLLYREEHDDRSVFFLDHVAAGAWEIRFRMRATTPGDFRVLPAKVTAMYVPAVTANSDARRMKIEPAAK